MTSVLAIRADGRYSVSVDGGTAEDAASIREVELAVRHALAGTHGARLYDGCPLCRRERCRLAEAVQRGAT